MHALTSELDIAHRLAREAGDAALRLLGHGTGRSGSSPVTETGRAAAEIMVDGLRTAWPEDTIVSEDLPGADRPATSPRVWFVKPLDASRECLARTGEFSIMIGLVVQDEPVLGVIHRPAEDILYSAARGAGAWVERQGRTMRLSCDDIDGRAPRLTYARAHADTLLDSMIDALATTDVESCTPVGIACAGIAENQRDLFIDPVPYLKEWDTCAPEVILREAGGHVTDCLGRPLRYNRPDPRHPHGILACAPGALSPALARVRPLYEETLSMAAL